jgi:hypothetical protein
MCIAGGYHRRGKCGVPRRLAFRALLGASDKRRPLPGGGTLMSRSWKYGRLAVVLALCLVIPACKNKLTKANVEKVKEGMTLDEVEKIIGKGNKETGDGSNVAAQFGVALPATPTGNAPEIYTWESGNKTVTLYVREGKVLKKVESGF